MDDIPQTTETVQPTETVTPTETPAPAPNPEPDGRQFVDLSVLPEDIRKPIEARINYLVGDNKATQRALRSLAEQHQQVVGRINELTQQTAQQNSTRTLEGLRNAKVEALQSGDYARAALIDEQIISERTKPAPQPIIPNPPPTSQVSITPEDEQAALTWAQERNDTGAGLRRPWTDPNHPKHQRMIAALAGIMRDPEFQNAPASKVLAEIDNLMGTPKPPARPNAPAVLGASNYRQPAKTADLSDDMKLIARKTWPKLKPEEAYAKYRANMTPRA